MAGFRASFGDELRRERERRGLALATLCAQTRVQERHLVSLETGDYDALPGGVFRKGIVRAYLSATGLPEEEWMPRFEQSLAEHARANGQEPPNETEAWATFAENVRRNRTGTGRRSGIRWTGVLLLFLLLGAAAWAVWHFQLRARLGPW